MYRDEILDLYKRPRNEGEIECPDCKSDGENPSCGDHTHIDIRLEGGELAEIKHQTDGCAISTAAISILSEELQGMSVEDVMALEKDWMLEKLDIEISPMRMKCALLGLETVQEAIDKT